MINYYKYKNRPFKALYLQILFVLFAFVFMSVSSFFLAKNIEKGHLEEQIEYTFLNIESLLNADLKEFETMLGMASETIRGMLVHDFDLNLVKQYMIDMTNYGSNKENIAGFFGFFAGFGEDGLDGFNALYPDTDWDEIIASGYVVQQRPWYIAASSSEDRIVITEPYVDELTKEVTFTYVKNIFDDQGKRLAIICLDVLLDRIYKFSFNNRNNDFSYWTLHDKNHMIITHPNSEFLGKNFRDVESGFTAYADEIEKEGSVYYRFAKNYLDRPSFISIKQLGNGWYLGVVAYADSYYSNLNFIIWFLVILSTLLSAGLILILVRINIKKEKSDNRLRKAIEDKKAIIHLSKILNGINAMIFVSDPDTDEILFINDGMKNIFNINTDCVGLICYKVLRNKETRCDFCPCNKLALEPEKEVVWEQHNDYKNRSYLNYSKYIKWINGKNVHIQYSVDITESKEAERIIAKKNEELEIALANAETANQTKSRFLAKMSHEIRTPMNAIIGMTELALRESGIDAKNNHIHTVKHAASNLLSIINDILDFSKIEAGKLEIISGDYSSASLLNDIVSIIRMRVIDSEIRFVVRADSRIPAVLHGDETRLRQAVLNILNNAVKYTEGGYVSFSVQAEFVNEDTVNLIFEVTDTGIGIKPEDMDRLFEDFTQFDLGKNKNIEGVGLGLAITKNVVEAMDGKIDVKSVYGESSVFTITVPQKYRSREAMAKVKNPEEKSVLVYERRDIYAESLEFTIKNLGVKSEFVSSGTELFEKMEEKSLHSNDYDFLFISYALFKKNKDTILKFGQNTKTIILAGFGEVVNEKNIKTLAMPVYCTAVAEIFNGEYNSSLHSAGNEAAIKFSAPSASVLIVDDISTNLKVAEGLLAPYNMNVDLCSSGKEAIEKVKKEKYDIVFMDHKMPVMDGIEATKKIREWDKYLPIIALTANAVSGMEEMFFQNGFTGFLSKPIDTVKLNEILEKWIPKEKQKDR